MLLELNLTGVQTYDLNSMTVHLHVLKTRALTTLSMSHMNKNMEGEHCNIFAIKPKTHPKYAMLYNLNILRNTTFESVYM